MVLSSARLSPVPPTLLAGISTVTVAVSVTGSPALDGLGELVSVMLVGRVPTVKLPIALLAWKLLSPE